MNAYKRDYQTAVLRELAAATAAPPYNTLLHLRTLVYNVKKPNGARRRELCAMYTTTTRFYKHMCECIGDVYSIETFFLLNKIIHCFHTTGLSHN